MARVRRRTVVLVCLFCVLFGSATSQGVESLDAKRAAQSTSAASSAPRVSAAAAGVDATMGKDDATQTALPNRRPTESSSSSAPRSTSTNTPLLVSLPNTHSARPTAAPAPGIAPMPLPPHHNPPPNPAPPPQPPPTTSGASSSPHSHHQPAVAIVFEALAGVVGLIVVLVLGKCCYSWRKTPRQDRIAALMNRHALDREMAELERAQLQQRLRARQVERVPPPPYIPAPPAYDDITEPEQAV